MPAAVEGSSTHSKERVAIAQAYSSTAWTQKVNKMSDTQVTAIYLRLKSQGKV